MPDAERPLRDKLGSKNMGVAPFGSEGVEEEIDVE